MPTAKKKIAATLKGRNPVPKNWDEHPPIEKILPFKEGDLVATTKQLIISQDEIDRHPIMHRSWSTPPSDDSHTFDGVDFAVYLGIQRLRTTRTLKGKGWGNGPRKNEHVYELHHVILVNGRRVVIPPECIDYLVPVDDAC